MQIPLTEGFLLSIGLIIAIGPQNLFVIKQGLLIRHAFVAALTCILCDLLLIGLGAMGLGSLIVSIPILRVLAIWGGVAFLLFYGMKSWMSVYRGHVAIHDQLHQPDHNESLNSIIMTALGFSLLNPHALLDTVVLIGGLASRFESLSERAAFACGAGIASACWFFSLSYGARLLRPLFQRKTTAAVFELLSGGLMLWISWGLVQSELFIDTSEEPQAIVEEVA